VDLGGSWRGNAHDPIASGVGIDRGVGVITVGRIVRIAGRHVARDRADARVAEGVAVTVEIPGLGVDRRFIDGAVAILVGAVAHLVGGGSDEFVGVVAIVPGLRGAVRDGTGDDRNGQIPIAIAVFVVVERVLRQPLVEDAVAIVVGAVAPLGRRRVDGEVVIV